MVELPLQGSTEVCSFPSSRTNTEALKQVKTGCMTVVYPTFSSEGRLSRCLGSWTWLRHTLSLACPMQSAEPVRPDRNPPIGPSDNQMGRPKEERVWHTMIFENGHISDPGKLNTGLVSIPVGLVKQGCPWSQVHTMVSRLRFPEKGSVFPTGETGTQNF